MKRAFALSAFFALLSLAACGQRRATHLHSPTPAFLSPAADCVFTSARSITALLALPDGTLWVGTTGGLLRRSPAGSWHKWTRQDGLPSEEVQRLRVEKSVVVAAFPQATAVWKDGQWQPRQISEAPRLPLSAAQTCAPVIWRGQKCVATLTNLELGKGVGGREFPLPPSSGTHISALFPHGDTLWAALYGDGLWAFDGDHWQPILPGLVGAAKEITALAASGPNVWIGTRRTGLWLSQGRGWSAASPHLDEPVNHNIQSMAVFRGALFAGTLEDGLLVRTAQDWHSISVPTLSSNAPRQMTRFGGCLYVRHGDGIVDRYDGLRWARNALAFLPRGRVSALASDKSRLYAAQWGGWSEYDGRHWTHYLHVPTLQGRVITSLCPEGDTLWLGTQGHGLAQASRRSGTVGWHDERNGLPDDWVTCLAKIGPHICVGTFVGGLASWNGAKWEIAPALRGENITALAPDGTGGAWIATRRGGWHQDATGRLTPLARQAAFLEPEQQALLAVDHGLWIGARTGLDYIHCAKETRPIRPINRKDFRAFR